MHPRRLEKEAGVLGTMQPTRIGSYISMTSATGVPPVHVTVFRLEVTAELATWPECDQRKRCWFSRTEAAAAVEEPDLQNLIRQLPNDTAMD